jgi:hypothetical protein
MHSSRRAISNLLKPPENTSSVCFTPAVHPCRSRTEVGCSTICYCNSV